MARTKQFTAEQVIEAMRGTGGIKKVIADRLKCSRATVSAYVRDMPTVRAAWVDERLSLRDAAEIGLTRLVQSGDYKAIAFVLTHIGEDGEIKPPALRAELSGKDGGPVTIAVVNVDTDKL